MKSDKDIGLLRQLVLRVLTFLQEATLKQDNHDMYYSLTKLHFKLYFGKNLVEEAVQNSREFRAAQRRHTAMIMLLALKIEKRNKRIEDRVAGAFQKNLLLEAEV